MDLKSETEMGEKDRKKMVHIFFTGGKKREV